MMNLRIGACSDSVVVNFVFYKCEWFIKGDVVPVVYIAVPGCGCVPCFVPDTSIFGVPACARTWISVKRGYSNCLVWRDCAVVRARYGRVWICRLSCIKNIL